jgi:hypothetical protein
MLSHHMPADQFLQPELLQPLMNYLDSETTVVYLAWTEGELPKWSAIYDLAQIDAFAASESLQ